MPSTYHRPFVYSYAAAELVACTEEYTLQRIKTKDIILSRASLVCGMQVICHGVASHGPPLSVT